MERRTLVYLHQDAEHSCATLPQALCKEGWHVYKTETIDQTLALIQQHNLCLGIIHLSESIEGTEADRLERLMQHTPNTAWVGIIPACLSSSLTRSHLIPGYFYDYHTEPLDWLRLAYSLGHAYGMAQASRNTRQTHTRQHCNTGMIGTSKTMQEVFRQIVKIAGVDASVMISGESGTGKELAARAIHNQSQRSSGEFVAINCGAISPNLIHSELFGHEKGAFTGAHRRKIGRLESANGGTIFLDEVADLPLELQVNLLRFLQEKTIERVGGMEPIPLDVRVIAASHIDLHEAVADGLFREDLFYRLNVIQLRMPALRERIEDIEPLAHYFFSIFARERNHNVSGFSQQALQAMCNFDWPGNVRELINRVRRATIMCERRLITPQELDLPQVTQQDSTETLAQARTEAERNAIQSSLRLCSNNISEAARRLGIARMTLYRLMHKHQLSTPDRHPASHGPVVTYPDGLNVLPFSLSTKSGGSQ